jgi:dehydrogenase/reductase SDR family member 12
MITLEETIQARRAIADCFRYLVDFSTSEQWDPGVYRAVKRSPGTPTAGTEFDLVLNSAGRRVPMRYRLVRVESPYRIELHGEGDGFAAHDVIQLRALGRDRTEIRYRAELQFDGAMGHLERVLHPFMVRMGRRAVAGLQRALTPDSDIPPASLAERLAYATLLPAARHFTEHGYLVMANKGLSDDMSNKRVVITGATAGLGLAAACELARLGAEVVLVGRDTLKLARAARTVRDFSGAADERIRTFEAELSLLGNVRRAGLELAHQYPRIDVLINNAGALFSEHGVTADGHERALAINLLCPWVLTQTLMPVLSTSAARVINVASGGMYLQPLRLDDMQFRQEPYDGAKAYARAKRALVAVTEYWTEQRPEIHFSSMHPGWAATPGVARSLPAFNQRMQRWLRDSRMGADTMVWLASSPAPLGHSGLFWFDRRPRPTAVLPGTAVTPAQRQALLAWLETEI